MARPVLLLSAIGVSCLPLSQIFHTVVLGSERFDAKAKITFRKLVKNRLFLFLTIPYIQSAVTLPATFLVLTHIAETSLEATTYIALITLLANAPMLIATYLMHVCMLVNA